MARTVITPTDPARAGIAFTQQAADTVNGNYVDAPDRCAITVNNTSGGPISLTVQYNGTFDGQAVTGKALTIPANTLTVLGNFRVGTHYQDADAGRLYLDSPSASLLIGAVRFPPGL